MDKIFEQIRAERERQKKLHGEFNDQHGAFDYHFIAVVLQKLGGATQVLQYIKRQDGIDDSLVADYYKELIQTAASVVSLLEKIETDY